MSQVILHSHEHDRIDGWVPRSLGGFWMLNADALLALVFVAADSFALQQINARCTAPPAIRP